MKKTLICLMLINMFSMMSGMEIAKNTYNIPFSESELTDRKDIVINSAGSFVRHKIPVHHYNKKIEMHFFGRTICFKKDYWDLYTRFDCLNVRIGAHAPEAILLKDDGSLWCFKYPKSKMPEEWLKFYKDGYPKLSK